MQALTGIGTPREDQQRQLTWTLRLSESELPTKEHTLHGSMYLSTYVKGVQCGLYEGLEQLDQGLSQMLLLVNGICSSSWAALFSLSGRGNT